VHRKNGESVVKKRLGCALVLALTTSVASGGGARAMSANAWHDLLEVLPDLKQMFDAAPGLLANDLPSLVSADGELQERIDRAKKFHSTHEFKEAEPKVDGDRLFSKDPNASVAMRNEYASFVDREARDIETLKARRDAQASRLADYQRLFDRNADFANKAPDLIGRAGKVSDEMAQELEHSSPKLKRIRRGGSSLRIPGV
jgi:arginine/lysine/ornithine decarboxylase